ncbi:acyltransferase [Marivirga tractuosa]|uniref:Acyltransferase family protein n=1 Tax=Marivirga tractuosa (strain ATCC 23168 / DSM 4126 / NBRC 15989 / NCIMB 1408 / VKM B-1430 / H-43) TaxID=643867 RepID=E4TLH2_MARTH|nr:acyltransferase family protein [Marivirga tractuosa]ADR21293.1 acyltransferase family protein [Marivirga tractuosa DSM 4126]BDD14253.1 acyltransferase [Marivirga tractuosa]
MLSERRYDIDWLRVIAIGLLLIYHIAIGFQPWGVFIGFIQNDKSLEWIWTPMSMLNVWRIPLLFFVSGMGVYFAIQRRSWKGLLLERSKRILLPFVFGMLVIVPLHVWLWQYYYHQDLSFMLNPAHLWFLGNIFIYVLIFTPLFFYLKSKQQSKLLSVLNKFMAKPIALLVLMIPFITEGLLVQPENFELYAMTPHGFWLGMLAFLTGFSCVYSGQNFWQNVTKLRWATLAIAFTLYLLRIQGVTSDLLNYFIPVESILWIFTVFGFGHKYLNHPSKALTYLSKAAYPIYIIHMFFLYLASLVIFPLGIQPFAKLVAVILATFAGCFISYEFLIRRISWIRPLFGLKEKLSSSKNSVTQKNELKLGSYE